LQGDPARATVVSLFQADLDFGVAVLAVGVVALGARRMGLLAGESTAKKRLKKSLCSPVSWPPKPGLLDSKSVFQSGGG